MPAFSVIRSIAAATSLVVVLFAGPALAIETPGTIRGLAGVNQVGGATYSLPLELPASLSGFQPELSLNYSSQSGFGYLGNGWTLGGIGAITRCSAVKALDKEYSPIRLDTRDYLCFNGKRLVDKAQGPADVGENIHLGEYRLESDDFSQVMARDSSGSTNTGSSVDRFTIKTKDGRTLYFGSTADSQQYGPSATSVALAWYLNRVEDRFGNYYTITYFQDASGDRGAIYPSAIYYTAKTGGVGAKYKISLSYAFLNEYSKASQLLSAQLKTFRYVNKITINEIAPPLQSGSESLKPIRDYKPSYTFNSIDNSFNLTSIQECGYTSVTGTYLCKNPTAFEYTASAAYAVCYNGAVKTTLSSTEPLNGFKRFFSDVNSDGRADIVLVKPTADGFKLATASSEFPVSDDAGSPCKSMSGTGYSALPSPISLGSGTDYSGTEVLAGDVNGDRKEDLVFVSKNLTVQVLKSNAESYFQDLSLPSAATDDGPATSKKFLADFDGDKILDVAAVSTFSEASSSALYTRISIRFGNGEGGFDSPIVWAAQMQNTNVEETISHYDIGDFNGDGRKDFAAFRVSMSHAPVILLARDVLPHDRGNLFSPIHPVYFGVVNVGIPSNASPVILDKNRDGLSDIFGFTSVAVDKNGDNVKESEDVNVSVSLYNAPDRPAGFVASTSKFTVSLFSGYKKYLSADFNGDGEGDLFYLTARNNGAEGALKQLHVTPAFGYGGGKYKNSTPTDTGNFVMKSGESVSSETDLQPYTVDVNGDGLTDIVTVAIGTNGLEVITAVTNAEYPHLLKKITDGNGAQTWFRYGVTTNPDVHEKKSVADGQVAITAPLYVVRQVTSDQGGTATTSVTYKYEGATADMNGRNFLGYQKVIATDPLNIVSTTTYELAFPYTGMVKSATRHRNGILLAESSSTFDNHHLTWLVGRPEGYPEKRVYFPYVKQSTSKTYTLASDMTTSSLVNQTVVDRVFDTYGNLASEITTVTGAGNQYRRELTQTHLAADEAKWRLEDLATRAERRMVYDGEGTAATPSSDITRTWSFGAYDPDTGFRQQEIVEPNDTALRMQIDRTADIYGHVASTKVRHVGDEGDAHPNTRLSSQSYDVSSYGASNGLFTISSTNALGQSVTQTINARYGKIQSELDLNGLETTWTYDELGRLKKEIRPGGFQTETTYLFCGPGSAACATDEKYVVEVKVGSQSPSRVYYDRLGRERRRTSPILGGYESVVATEYDELGRVKRVSRPYVSSASTIHWMTNEYDELGRIKRVIDPDSHITASHYEGNTVTVTNPRSATRKEERSALGQLVKVTDADAKPLQYRYDAFGELIQTIDAVGNVTRIERDKLGRKVAQYDANPDPLTYPNLGKWSYQYDYLGQLVWQQTPEQQGTNLGTSFVYDRLGRLIARDETDLKSRWVYDNADGKGIGKLARAYTLLGDGVTPDYERWEIYDELGRLSKSTTAKRIDSHAQASDPDFEYVFTYDTSSGRLDTVTYPRSPSYPNGFGYQNVYEAASGLLKQVVDKADTAKSYWTAETMDAAGNITREVLGNQLLTTRSYRPATGLIDTVLTGGQVPAGSQNAGAVIATVQNDVYSFDAVGNLELRYQNFNNTGVLEAFQYDSLNRLKRATSNMFGDMSVDYDAIGNITSRPDVGTYGYSFADCKGVYRVCSITGSAPANFSYDDNGNLTAKYNGEVLPENIARSVTWTSYNLPEQIVQGTTLEAFQYTPDRDRIRRISTVEGQETTTYYFNPRIDLGNTYERSYRPDGTMLNVYYLYAGAKVIGSVVDESTVGNAVWSTDLAVAPTTADPNAAGLTMPVYDPNQLVTWVDNAGNGQLAFKTTYVSQSTTVGVTGQRAYLNEGVIFRTELTTTPNVAAGRRFAFEVFNNGDRSQNTLRWHRLIIGGATSQVMFMDGTTNQHGDSIPTTQSLNYAIADNQAYVVEIETTTASSVLYLYKKGESRAQGVSHTLSLDWRGAAGSLVRAMRAQVSTGTQQSTPNIVYADNFSESIFAAPGPRYFHADHLGSVMAVSDSAGAVLERFSYDPWGQRRDPEGAYRAGVVWSTELLSAPTTADPNAEGITMPASDQKELIRWDNSGFLEFKADPVSVPYEPVLQGQRQYVEQKVALKAEFRNPTNGGYLKLGWSNGGSAAAAVQTLRRYSLYLQGDAAKVEYVDGTVDPATGDLAVQTATLPLVIASGTDYVVEVETSVSYGALYLYKKGEGRGQGVSHVLPMDWQVPSVGGYLSRRLTASALGYPQNSSGESGRTKVFNLSESVFGPRTPADPQSTTRGFTLHEHLDSVGLVHMNGRIYDPVVGRFLSADPNVFYPEDMQDHNRYSYVHNNPLSFTDPSGHFLEELGGADLGEISISLGDAIGSFIGWSSSVVGSVTTNYGISRAEAQSNVTSNSLGGAAYLTPTKTAITNVADRALDASIHYQSAGNYVAGINDAVSFGLATQFWAALGYDTSYTSSDSYQAGLLTGATGMMWLGAESLALNGVARSAPVVSEVANSESLIYRTASGTPSSLTPRPVDVNGLSAFNSLENALPGKVQVIDPSKFRNLCAVCDNASTGHVSILPKDSAQMQGWIESRGGAEIHPLTQELMDVIIGTVRK